jgi:photosystem II stability/assembly factor-like uncharacterized protein
MKKFLIIFILLLSRTVNIFAQFEDAIRWSSGQGVALDPYKSSIGDFNGDGWDDKSPPGLISGYYSDMFFDSQGEYGWAVGSAGKVLKTTDGGSNWLPVVTGIICDYHSVYFIDELTGWIVGGRTPFFTNYDAYIIKTTDGGDTWITQYTSNEVLNDVHFIDEISGWVVGSLYPEVNNKGCILNTTDGGQNWSRLNFEPGELYSVEFYDSKIGYVGGSNYGNGGGDVHKTSDGGNSWTTFTFPNTGDNERIMDLDVFGLDIVYCLNKDRIYFTNNGGFSWVDVFTSSNDLIRITSKLDSYVFAFDNNHSYIYKSQIYSTNWDTLATNPEVTGFTGIKFCDNGRSYVITKSGIFLTSVDGGLTWDGTKITVHGFNSLFINSQQVIVGVDGGRFWKSSDSGNSWVKKQIPTLSSGKVEFWSDLVGWIYTNRGLFKTIDGGETWLKVSQLNFESLTAISSQILIATLIERHFGVHGFSWTSRKILRSEDGGVNWQTRVFTDFSGFSSLVFIDENIGWEFDSKTDVTNYPLNMFKTSNGGISWQLNGIKEYIKLWSPIFINNNLGFAIVLHSSLDTMIVKTNDSGFTWSNIFTSDVPLYSLFFINENYGWVCGANGMTFKTTNGGVSFDTIQTFTSKHLYAIKFIDSLTGYITGQDGIVLQTSDGGITFTEDGNKIQQEINFSLSQNYPNPFNSNSIISYTIPKESLVKLSVFNSIGQMIETLVNEIQSAGIYKINFNATGLVSGIYYYQLLAADKTITRKLILLK